MASAIDPTVPVFGSPTTASVRNNFLIAKNEITALQAAVGVTLPLPVVSGGTGATSAPLALANLGAVPLAGGSMTGLLRLSGNPTDILGATPKQYVDSYFPVAISNGGTGANNATQALLNLGAVGTNSPAFTGIPTAPTPSMSDSTNTIATTAFVHSVLGGTSIVNNVSGGNGISVSPNIGNVVVSLSAPVSIANGGTGAGTAPAALAALGGAPLASPTFTGIPAAPTAAPGVNTTQIATTAFVMAAVAAGTSGVTFLSGGNGITVNQNVGAVQVSLTSPVTLINGGSGATSGNAALDNFLGVGSNANGVVTRQTNGAYTLAQVLGQFIGDSPPTSPIVGQLWWDSIGGQLYIFYNDGNSSQWVISNNNTAGAGTYLPLTGGTINPGPLFINANVAVGPAPSAGTLLHVQGIDGANVNALVDAFGASASAYFVGRRARGTGAAPTALQTFDLMASLGASGWNSTAYAFGGIISLYAIENWSATANGSAMNFQTITPGTTTANVRMEIKQGVIIGTDAPDPGQGALVLNAVAAAPQPLATYTPQVWIAGEGAALPALVIDEYGPAASLPALVYRKARGTAAAPTAVQLNDVLAQSITFGRGATGYGAGTNLYSQAVENWTDAAHGAQLVFSTTPAGGFTQVASLTLAGNAAFFSGTMTAVGVINITAGAGGSQLFLNGNHQWYLQSDNSANLQIIDNTAAAQRIIIDSAGNCHNNTGTWSTISDPRTKTGMAPWNEGLQAVLALNPITFHYNGLAGTCDDGREHLGLDASEVQAVLPDLVLATEQPLEEGGEPTAVLSVDLGKLVFPLINAVKELTARLEALEGRA